MFQFKRLLVTLILLVISGVVIYIVDIWSGLPEFTPLALCPKASKSQAYMCSNKNPHFVPLSQISPHLINAILISEDIGFFQHHGFDYYEIQQSFFTNLEKGRFARGGSTITQQMVKNVYLTSEKTLRRKIYEMYLTRKVEKSSRKEVILETYLNAILFGPEVYGIGLASQYYFGKSAYELNILEAAFLAFLLPNPILYSKSFKRKELSRFAKSSLNRILSKMNFYHRISPAQYDLAQSLLDKFPWNDQGLDDSYEELRLVYSQ